MNRSELLLQLPSAWKANYDLAQWLVSYIQPETTVDLGVDWGYSSFVLAEQSIGTVYAVDWFQGDQHAGYRNTFDTVSKVKELGNYSNITIVKSDFAELAKSWALDIDILHVDGEHTYEAVSANYYDWVNFVKDSGVILLHDTVSHKSTVGKFFEELDLPKINFEEDCGLGILSKDATLIDNIKKYISKS
jgi:predicted O-methyltransferase YrrM